MCYGMPPLCSVMGKRKDIIGVMSNLLRLLQINHDLCHKGTNISESCNISCKFIAETGAIITKKRLRFLVTSWFLVLPQVSNYWTSGMTSVRLLNSSMKTLGLSLCWRRLYKWKKEGKKTAKKRASSVTFYLRTPNASVMRTNFHCLAIDNSLVRLDFDKFLSSVHFDTKFQQNRKLFFHVSYSGVSAV